MITAVSSVLTLTGDFVGIYALDSFVSSLCPSDVSHPDDHVSTIDAAFCG